MISSTEKKKLYKIQSVLLNPINFNQIKFYDLNDKITLKQYKQTKFQITKQVIIKSQNININKKVKSTNQLINYQMKVSLLYLFLIMFIYAVYSQYIIRIYMNNKLIPEVFVNVTQGTKDVQVNFTITARISGDDKHKYQCGMLVNVQNTTCKKYFNSTTDRQSVYDLYGFVNCTFPGPFLKDQYYFIQVTPHVIDINNWNITNQWYKGIGINVNKKDDDHNKQGGDEAGNSLGIILGSIGAGVVVLGVLIFLTIRKRNIRLKQEKLSLLSQQQKVQEQQQNPRTSFRQSRKQQNSMVDQSTK